MSAQKNKTLAWFNREQGLERQTALHNSRVQSVFPEIISEEDVPSNRVALPSACQFTDFASETYSHWINTELGLHVGMGHNLLQEIRNAAGLQNYYSRKQKKKTRGFAEMKSVAQSQKRIGTDKSRFVQKYNRNWKHIQTLLNLSSLSIYEKPLHLKGLRAITGAEDITFFTNMDDNGDRTTDSKISWIWEVAMLDQPEHKSNRTMEELVTNWESEGEAIIAWCHRSAL